MSYLLIFEQALNGVQLGLMLFLMAAGLTLIFGIMDFVNLTHGSLYMLGGFFAAYVHQVTGSFLAAVVLGCVGVFVLGLLMEALTLRKLYERSHLDHVLATFGLLLFFNELALILFGAEPVNLPKPQFLTKPVEILGINYSSYRLAITLVAIAVAIGLFVLIVRTRIGMLIRAGASNREMVIGLGVNIRWLYTLVFGLGAGLAALAGVMTTPLLSIQVGAGEPIMIVTFVVIVIGGIGSIRGAFFAAILVGLIDTIGRSILPIWLGYTVGPAIASMSIYIAMAAILFFKPQGLFAARRG